MKIKHTCAAAVGKSKRRVRYKKGEGRWGKRDEKRGPSEVARTRMRVGDH